VKSKKCEKLLKKRSSKFFRTGILEVGLRPKKRSRNILAAPPFQISKYATGARRHNRTGADISYIRLTYTDDLSFHRNHTKHCDNSVFTTFN
jgi:hypothetical protein